MPIQPGSAVWLPVYEVISHQKKKYRSYGINKYTWMINLRTRNGRIRRQIGNDTTMLRPYRCWKMSQFITCNQPPSLLHVLFMPNFKCKVDTRNTAGTAENPACQQTLFCNIQIKVAILLLKIYLLHTDLIRLEIWVTLTLTCHGHPRSSVMVSLHSPYVVSYWWLIITYCLIGLL